MYGRIDVVVDYDIRTLFTRLYTTHRHDNDHSDIDVVVD